MRQRSTTILIAIALVLAIGASASAGSYLYAGKRKKINCGIVVVQGASQPLAAGLDASGNPALGGGVGDLFYILDAREDLKPAGWSLDNPLAPSDGTSVLRKNNPLYWQVNLQAASDLSRMHVLYLPASSEVKLNPLDREKLRQFVDSGGVLWIDNAGDLSFGRNGGGTFFLPDFYFESASGNDFAISRHHPLLSLPYWLSDADISMLGSNWGKAVCNPGYDSGEPPVVFDVLYPVVGNTDGGKPSMAANAYGSGRIVATSSFAGRGCYLNYPFSTPSLKFAYNVIAWSSSWTHLRKNPRHTGSSIDTVGGTKLLEFWSLSGLSGGAGTSTIESAPVIYKNVAFYTNGGRLFALDLLPQEDLDHDGITDDGFQIQPTSGEDIIWYFDDPGTGGGGGGGGGRFSAPSVVTIQDPANPENSMEIVLVQSSSGIVFGLPAFPLGTDGFFEKDPGNIRPLLTWDKPPATTAPSPPLYVNGWIYAIGGDGRLYANNPALKGWITRHPAGGIGEERASWCVPGDTGGPSGNAEPRSGPAFGYVKNEASGATVGMVYWFAGPWNIPGTGGTAAAGTELNDHVYGVPVLVSNDRIKPEHTSANGLETECRISYRDGFISDIPAPIVQIGDQVYSGGDISVNTRLTGSPGVQPGYIVIRKPIPANAVIYATYALDYSSIGSIQYVFPPRVRQPLEPRSNSTSGVPPTSIAAMPAVGPDAMIFLAGKRGGSSGSGSVIPSSIYGIMNDGTSQSTRWNYFMHSGLSDSDMAGAGRSSAPVPSVVYGPHGEKMMDIQCKTSPAVSGDKVFTTVSGTPGPGGEPTAALVCFKAASGFVIRITDGSGMGMTGTIERRPRRLINDATGREVQVKIWQPNLLAPGVGGVSTPLLSSVVVRRDMIDYERGTITFDNFDTLKLRGGPGNIMQTNTFSPSLPVWVFLDNVEVPIDWSTWAPSKAVWGLQGYNPAEFPSAQGEAVDLSGWNNMLWFYRVPDHEGHACSGISSSPVVIGSTVYFVCDDGYLYALPTETGESTGGPIDDKLLIWEGKISDTAGSTSVNSSIAGSNGVLLVPAKDGLHAYTNATTLVADSNRLVEMDGAGEIKWAVDSVAWPVAKPAGRDVAPSVTSGPVNKPSRARYLPSGEILLVNTGANQVCRIDKSGSSGLGSVGGADSQYFRGLYDRFVDPKGLLRPGQPTSLSSPTDALFWQEFEKQNSVIYRVDHCLIADSGNHRVVDLVFRFEVDQKTLGPTGIKLSRSNVSPQDPNTGFYLPELNWVSVTDSMNERYTFDCIQLVPNEDGSLNDVWAAVSNYRGNLPESPTSPDMIQSQGLGGAIFALRYRTRPSPDGQWDYASQQSGQIVAACDRFETGSSGVTSLACPRYFQVIDTPGAGRFLLICDNYGVYELSLGGGGVPRLERFLKDEDYRNLGRQVLDSDDGSILSGDVQLGIPLQAASVEQMPNGNWLITNSYSGTDTSGLRSFSGEVFEVEFSGGVPSKVAWCSPPLYMDGVIGLPSLTQKLQNGYVLQQPRSAIRQR